MITDAALARAISTLDTRVREGARSGVPLTRQAAIELLRQAGVSRANARRVIAVEADSRWTLVRRAPARQGGRPAMTLVPLTAPVCARPQPARTHPDRHPEPADPLRVRLMAAARAAGFPRLEIRCQVVILDGEHWWQRFAALAPPTEIATALLALGVPVDEGDR